MNQIGSIAIALFMCAMVRAECQGQINRFLTAAEMTADLDSLESWVQAVHPKAHEPATQGALNEQVEAAARVFGAGAPVVMMPIVINQALSALADEHTGIDWQQWTQEAAEEAGIWPGNIEVSHDGQIHAFDSKGQPISEIGGVDINRAFPHHFFQNIGMPFSPATLSQRIAALAPGWFPLMYEVDAETFNPPSPLPNTNEAGLTWDKDGNGHWTIVVKDFSSGSWKDFVRRIDLLRSDLNACNEMEKQSIAVDLTGNAGGELMRAMMFASLFQEGEIEFFKQVELLGSDALQAWGRSEIPRFRRLFLSVRKNRSADAAYAHAILRTPSGQLVSRPSPTFVSSETALLRHSVLMVQTDGLTASAAGALTSWLQRNQGAEIHGVPPFSVHGKVCGNVIKRRLPNSGIPLNLATTCWSNPIKHVPIEVDVRTSSLQQEPWSQAYPQEAQFLTDLMVSMKRSGLILETDQWDHFEVQAQPILIRYHQELEPLLKRQNEFENWPVNRTLPDGTEVALALTNILAERALLKERRDASLKWLLPFESWSTFADVLNPEKPKVLHFGIHDRMNCNVCRIE